MLINPTITSVCHITLSVNYGKLLNCSCQQLPFGDVFTVDLNKSPVVHVPKTNQCHSELQLLTLKIWKNLKLDYSHAVTEDV